MLLVTLEDQMNALAHDLMRALGVATTVFAVKFGLPEPGGTPLVPVARALVNHGRWIVRCPFCRGAEHASEQDHRFMCGSCRNKQVDGRWLAVDWPGDAAEIETVLLRRDLQNRNWELSETVEDLQTENTEHGV